MGHTQGSSRTAPNACSACWSRKRGCDRRIPTCFRCAKTRLWCTYSNCKIGSVRVPRAVASGLRDAETVLRSCDVDDVCITFNVRSILTDWHTDVETVVACHQNALQAWLPIVPPKSLSHVIANFAVAPCAEMAALVLHLLLTNPWTSGHKTTSGKSAKLLYNTCKSLFLQLQVIRRDSLATIQVGLLLAVFELGEGLLPDSHATMQSCAKLWTVSKLQQHQQALTGISPTPEEVECVRWAIYALDRLQSLVSGQRKTPMIPDQDTTIENSMATHSLSDLDFSLSIPVTTPTDTISKRAKAFEYQIRAFRLLDRVRLLNLTAEPQMEGELWQGRIVDLDAALQQGIAQILNGIVEDSWVAPYHAVVIIFCALIELHTEVIRSYCPTSSHSNTMLARSILAVETVINMTSDMVRLEETDDFTMMPLAAVVLLRKCASAALSLSLYRGRAPSALQNILGSLGRAKRRWGVAGLIESSLPIPSSECNFAASLYASLNHNTHDTIAIL